MRNGSKTPTTRSRYALKKQRMQSGSYTGQSPFFSNLPEFQHVQNLRNYNHLRSIPGFRFPSVIKRTTDIEEEF